MTIKYRKIKFKVQHQERIFSLNDQDCIYMSEGIINYLLVPKKIAKMCQDANINGYFIDLPYLSLDSFDLFMNLIVTPEGIQIYNPKQLTQDDLGPVIAALTYPEDKIKVDALVARLNKDPELKFLLDKISYQEGVEYEREKNQPGCLIL